MPTQYKNPILHEALEKFRADQTNENLYKASHALLNTKVMTPAEWDQEPKTGENGELLFNPDTRISLGVVRGQDDTLFFPVFTSSEEVQNFYKGKEVRCLILELNQILPFLGAAEGKVKGIVVDPAGVNVPFNEEFLKGISEAYKKTLEQNTIQKGTQVRLQDPAEKVDDLEAALISSGYNDPAINAIYLKERLDSDTESHWFVIVDSNELDTTIFQRIGEKCKGATHGKNLEFLFTNQKLGAEVAAQSKPIYTRLGA